jgi:hypothetical protein
MQYKTIIFLLFYGFFILQAQALDNMVINSITGLKTWQLSHKSLDLQLVQRLPDQTRGFFQGRGFTSQQANEIATQCVFQTIVKNTSSIKSVKALNISLRTWRIKKVMSSKETISPQALQAIKLKEDWFKAWQAISNPENKVKPSAQVAFKWALFPTEQTFTSDGDYNWGMISFGLAPETHFDLHIFWEEDQQLYDKWLYSIECPQDN